MKVLVPLKRVLDANIRVRVNEDGSGVALAGAKMAMNPFDEIALEEAIRLKEAGIASEVVAVSIGEPAVQDVLRTGLAMGADRAICINAEAAPEPVIEPLAVAKVLAALVRELDIGLVVMGKQSIDGDNNQTGQMLSALLGWGQATFASALSIEGGNAVVVREVDTGSQTVRLALPAVVTADLRLNTPRYASLPNIMRARQKPLEQRDIGAFGVDVSPRLRVLKTEPPPARAGGVMLASVGDLVNRLRNEAGIERAHP